MLCVQCSCLAQCWCVMAANVKCDSACANQTAGLSGQNGGKRAATLLASRPAGCSGASVKIRVLVT